MINVLFFAELQERLGKEKITLEAAGMTVAEVIEKWIAAYELPNLEYAMIAVNESYASKETILEMGIPLHLSHQ